MRTLLAVLGALLFVASGVALRLVFPHRASAATAAPVTVDAPGFGPRALVVGDRADDITGADLPAISLDGSQIVTLKKNGQDFSGDTFVTLRFLSARSGRIVASYELAAPALSRETRRARVEAAQARLATTRWRSLVHGLVIGGRYEDVAIVFPPLGTRIRIPRAERDHLRFEGALWQERRIVLPPMGFVVANPGVPCGAVEGYTDAYMDPSLGAVLLEPDAAEGGDECMGQLGIDQLFVVPLR